MKRHILLMVTLEKMNRRSKEFQRQSLDAVKNIRSFAS